MPKILYRVTLTQEERTELEKISSSGNHSTQKVYNALILLGVDEGEFQKEGGKKTGAQLALDLPISTRKVDRVKKRFVEYGLDVALNKRKADRQRFRKIDGDVEAHLVALSCSAPPEGHVRWTMQMLADKLVELEFVDSISHETVRKALKKTN